MMTYTQNLKKFFRPSHFKFQNINDTIWFRRTSQGLKKVILFPRTFKNLRSPYNSYYSRMAKNATHKNCLRKNFEETFKT